MPAAPLVAVPLALLAAPQAAPPVTDAVATEVRRLAGQLQALRLELAQREGMRGLWSNDDARKYRATLDLLEGSTRGSKGGSWATGRGQRGRHRLWNDGRRQWAWPEEVAAA